MDAKTRDLGLLAALSLFLASFAWAMDDAGSHGADMDQLILKRASASRPSGHWSDDDYDVLFEGEVVGRIMKVTAAPEDTPWMWTLAYGHQRPLADARLRADARSRDEGVR